ncbi:MAG: 4-(cytidine 5'-diphospho)-2-C-methyl-D-erythritol kinase [Chromatiales bacterium]|nr:4-(cytidine 5'-diphospho)-2-C-methyl-D-erythritol kinase [Chromatiales bacterium]
MSERPGSGWPAPAKLNLFLHIVGRRDDGYHLLQTVFQFLDHGDRIDFELREDGRIERRHDLPGVPEAADLTLRAARHLQALTGCRQGADIRLDKRLPLGGGLGGGSSDAATVLVALNYLWDLGLNEDELAAIGLELGADVPVFVRGRAAWAEGVGENLTPVDLPEPRYLVIKPPVEVSTARVFGAPELTRDCTPLKIRDFLSGRGTNVCEPVVRAMHVEVAGALDWLQRAAGRARMTGTGSCVFAPFDDPAQAMALLPELPTGCTGFIARGMNRSPLLHRLATARGVR